MRYSWLDLVAGVLRPARSRLADCLRQRELQQAARRPEAERRARAIADCEARIERERAAVLAANDGVISLRMRDLEREWRALSRLDPEGEVMELWARIAPGGWVDRKRWRDAEPASRIDAAIALAADVEGVEAAEAAFDSLFNALSRWGVRRPSRIHWRWVDRDPACLDELFAEPVRAARAALSTHPAETIVLARAAELERAVFEAARLRLPHRPVLAGELARAAFGDVLLSAAALDRPNPVTALRELLKTGYVLAGGSTSGVALEIPPL
jgi:hypothetical protein